ncbi:MAG: hypothetical protein AAB214_10750 [Fibrobacterota bacterium]
MSMQSLKLRIGGMESRQDVQALKSRLETLVGIEAYDVIKGHVRLTYDSKKIPMADVFAVIAETGEGYDVEME